MATYTDNYQLTKPTYAEQADIGVINSNMNKIDNVMHSSQISLAPAYDSTKAYAEGDVVMYELLMYKCISPTTGVWDASKWERTTASESGGGGSAELDILGEASGAVASFSDGASAGLAKCIADINPVQDLHGYSKPWAGGAGKNLLPMTVNEIKTNNVSISWNGNVGTIYGVTITLHTDDGISVSKISISGTPTNTAYLYVGAFNLKSDVSYVLNGCPSNKPNNDVLYVSNQPSGFGSWIDSGNGATYNATQDWNGISFFIRIWANTVQNNDWYPMIRLATETDPAFEPYSNICPISGSTSVTVTVSDGETSTTKTTPLGQTVYGGQLNVLTGELTITHKAVTVNDLQWYKGTSGSYARFYSENVSDIKLPSSQTSTDQTVIAEQYETLSIFNDILTTNGGIVVNTTGAINITDDGYTSAADFKTAKSSMRICYELAIPQTVQLTPQEVNSLLGQNNISADTGDIDIVYVKASAPIQPNPTGEPTATLKKLGINGTIYGITGSGGGGGDGDTNVYGAFIDTNRVIYDSFVFDETEHTWTATSDCILAGYIDAPSTSRSCYVDIDSVDAFIDYESHNGVFIPVKEGQIVTYLAKSGSVMKAYGLTFGTQNIFTPQIYSTEEREVGVWIDNKPLYQKTYNISQTILEKTGTVISSISVSGMNLINGLAVEHTNSQATPVAVYTENNTLKVAPPIRFLVDSVTIWYTKTTDTAGSGSYNTLGVPMVHYSTDEQIVGTWIDGKTIYQKTCNVTTNTNCDNTTWTSLPLDNPPANADYMVDAELHGQCPNTNRTYRFQFENGAVQIASLTSEYILANTKITFRYTKSSS